MPPAPAPLTRFLHQLVHEPLLAAQPLELVRLLLLDLAVGQALLAAQNLRVARNQGSPGTVSQQGSNCSLTAE